MRGLPDWTTCSWQAELTRDGTTCQSARVDGILYTMATEFRGPNDPSLSDRPSGNAIPRSSLASAGYAALRKQILSGCYEPGERLVERRLAEDLGLSRSPIREALRSLSRDGLVTILPHRGAYVSDISDHYIADLLEIRERLERFAVSRAIERVSRQDLELAADRLRALIRQAERGGADPPREEADFDLHQWLVRGSRSGLLQTIMAPIWDIVAALRVKSHTDREGLSEPLKEHLSVIEAMIEGDGQTAEERLAEHLKKAAARISHPRYQASQELT